MRILAYMGHPAHYHLMRLSINRWINEGHSVLILLRKKDILEELVRENKTWTYVNIQTQERNDGFLSIASSVLRRSYEFYKQVKRFKPDVMAGTSVEISIAGKLSGIPSVVINEDDAQVVPLFAKLAYPLATYILAPDVCDCGKWNERKSAYPSYHELAYLHPDHFKADFSQIASYIPRRPFFILRFAKLSAHHDVGRRGIEDDIAAQLIKILEPVGDIYITSERKLAENLDRYRIGIPPSLIHHALGSAKLYIGDSQTMAAEAMVLGTPSIRYNDFVGEIGYLNELENKYELGIGIRTGNTEKLMQVTREWIHRDRLAEEWEQKRLQMLAEKINFADYLHDFILRAGNKKGIKP